MGASVGCGGKRVRRVPLQFVSVSITGIR